MEEKKERMENNEKSVDQNPSLEEKYTDDELIEDIDDSEDDAPVEVFYRCKKCGQILGANAKDCWKCSSTDLELVVEEETKNLKKTMLQARCDRLEHEIKEVKKTNNLIFFLIVVIIVVLCVLFLTR